MFRGPINHPERLASLERSGLLDSPPEAVFDALVELARDLLGGTAALVSLVDDHRQFLKAQVGLGEPWASARQTPLSHSFCQHVVTTNAPLLVSNSRLDARVQGNGAIDDLGIIAYAGVPLVDEDAHTLGALCVIDGQPREWTQKEVRTLKTLAKAVMAEVALRQTLVHRQQEAQERERLVQSLRAAEAEREQLLRQVRASEAQLRLVMDALPVQVSFVTADERYGVVNTAYEEWFGISEEQMRGRKVREVIGEAAYAVLGPYVRRGLAGESFSFEQHAVPYRLGGARDVKVSFISHQGADGHVEGYVAMLQDVTQLRRLEREREEALTIAREAQAQAEAERGRLEVLSHQLAEREQLLRLVVEGAGLSAWSMDCRTRLITADARFLNLYGIDPSSPVPLSAMLGRMHPEDRPGTERAIEAAIAGENEGRYLAERRIQGTSGGYHWGETRAQVVFAPDGTALTMRGVSFDVTVRKEAETLREELFQRTQAESERQQRMFEQAPAVIALLEGPEHRFRVANARYLQLVGGRQVLGRTVAEALPEVVEQGFITLLDTVRRTGEPYVGRETWVQLQRRPGGPLEDVCVDFAYQPIRDASDQVNSIFVHAVEVTDLVRSREASRMAARELGMLAETLRASEERLNLALDVVGAGIWELDMSTQEVVADQRFRELFGLTPDESFALEKGLSIVHPEDRARVAMAVAEAIAGKQGGAYEADYRTVPRADGSFRWVAARGQVFLTPEGEARRFIGTGVDISERKNAEFAQARLLHSIADQDVFGVAVLEGPKLRFTLANEGYRRICGGRDVLGKPMLEALPELVGQGTEAVLHEVLRTGRPITSAEARFMVDMHGTGELEARFFTFTWQAISSQSGGFSSVLVLSHDITEGVRTRTALETTAERLHRSETRLALALEVSGTGTWELDLATNSITADSRLREMFGLTPEEPFDLATALAIIHTEDRARAAALVEGALAGEGHGRYEAEYRMVSRQDGGIRWVAARGQTTSDASGRVTRFLGTGTDITARKQAEFARTSLLHSLSDQPVFGVAVLRGDELSFEMANSAYRQLVGERDVVGKPFLVALAEFIGQGADTGMREVLRTGKSFSGREVSYYIARHGSGAAPEERFFNLVWQPIFNPSGVADSLLAVTHDVTDQVRARKRIEFLLGQLAASEERQKRMVAASGAGLWELEGATGRMTADARMVELMGLPPGTVFNLESGLDEVNPEDREPVARAVAAALAGENEGNYLMLFRTGGRNGVPERWVESRAQRMVDAAGTVVLAGAMLDITARKRAEDEREDLVRREAAAHTEAEATRARLAKFVENAPAALGTVRGPQHVFEMVNPRYRELMGTHRQLLGRPMAEAAPEVVAQGFIQLFDTVYRTGEPFFAEGIPAKLDRRGDGTLEDVFFNLTFQPARDLQGQVEGVDIFGFDVTSQVRLRQREEELKRLAEERTALEQQLIGIVSHDLRNPLAAILMGASVLARSPALNERSIKTVLRIASAAERASRMVKDLLDFTQARLGKGIPVYPRALNLAEALEGWVEETRAAFAERTVNVHVQGGANASVDPDRMAQVVGNLLSNALKYSPPDSPVEVRLREEPEALVLEVHNTGTPIPEAQQVRVFQPLERGLDQRDMSSRSVGLGLFIVKHVVEAHGGSISVTSTAEAGTTFSVRLPL